MLFLIVPRSLSHFAILSLPFISSTFTEGTISDVEFELFTLPVHHGGLGIADPVKSAPMAARAMLVNTILGCNVLCVTDH